MKEPFVTPDLLNAIVEVITYAAAAVAGWLARILQTKKNKNTNK